MNREEMINKRVREHYAHLEGLGYEIVGLFLQGSQNYNNDIYDEDRMERIKLVVRIMGVSVEEYNKIHNCEPMLYSQFCGIVRDICPISWLFETEEEANWVVKMHAEYIEHFNPPSFENLPYEYSFKFIRNGIEHELFCKRDSYIVVISCCKDYMSGTDDMEYNEENYTKAVEYARSLFLGE